MQIGSQIKGVDLKGNKIQGTIENVVKLAGIAIIKTGEDRTHITEAYINDLEEIIE